MTLRQIRNKLYAEKLIAAFEKRNMTGYYFDSKEEALEKIIEMLPANALVSCGGSETLHEIGLTEQLRNGDYSFLDPHTAQDATAKEQIAYQALTSDYYFMGCNAIAETGELVNIDGIGNRVASLIFGPKNVIVVAGMNKIMPDLQSAVHRAKTYAAQMIVLKFNNRFESFDELAHAAEGAESQLVITSRTVIKDRIKIVLIGDTLGY